MKKLIILLPFTFFSCNEINDSTESDSLLAYAQESNLLWINDTLRVVYDTVLVVNDDDQVKYFYSYDNVFPPKD